MLWNKNKIAISMLSPKSLKLKSKKIDGRWEYIERLRQAIRHKDGYNIAVSGSYGTGKSSIVKTFVDHYHLNHKTTTINIGSFFKTNSSNTDEIEVDLEENVMEKVEKSIVKQLVYQLPYRKARLSSIPRLQKHWKLKYTLYSIFITIAFCGILRYFINPVFYHNILNNSILFINQFIPISYEKYISFFHFLFILSILWLFCSIVYYSFVLTNKAKTKVKIHNYELELEKNVDSKKFSFMDNIHEILYYFINSRVEIVFFEDIDRYEEKICLKVIEDLKELNSIINSCYEIRHKVVFVYSFKDSIFEKPSDKNKFYDYIVSVMPISTSYNSYTHLMDEIKDAGLSCDDLDNRVLRITSSFVYDFRTIKSIANDYGLFLKVSMSCDKPSSYKTQLFALCVFKNCYLKEYDEITDNHNVIDEDLKEFSSVIDKKIESEITHYNYLIEDNKNKKLELKNALLNRNSISGSLPKKIIINDDKYSIDDFLKDDFPIQKFQDNTVFVEVLGHTYEIKYDTDASEFIHSILICDDKIKDNQKELKYLDKCNNDLDTLYEYSSKFIEGVLYDNVIPFSSQKNNLVYDLIFRGFIRPNYIDFITSISDSSYLSVSDNRFISNYQHQIYDFLGNIDHPENVLEYLTNWNQSYYYLNYGLASYIFNDNKDLISNFIDPFIPITDNHLKFLSDLRSKDLSLYRLIIEKLSPYFSKILDVYFGKDFYGSNLYDHIIVDLLLVRKVKLEDIGNKEQLRNMIYFTVQNHRPSFIYDYLSKNKDNKTVLDNLRRLEVRFPNITYLTRVSKNSKIVLDNIVKNDLYSLNRINVTAILLGGNYLNSYTFNYSNMMDSIYSEYFKETILNHLDEFMDSIYLTTTFIFDDEEMISKILQKTKNHRFIRELVSREKLSWKIIRFVAGDNKELNSYLIHLILENISSFSRQVDSHINDISPVFINQFIDQLFNNKHYVTIENILSKYDCFKLDKSSITKNMDQKELSLRIKYGLISYSKNNYLKISDRCSEEERITYLRNCIRDGRFDTLYLIIDEENLILLKDYLDDLQKIRILNSLYKKNKYSNRKISSLMYLLFDTNIEYSISYVKEYKDHIFNYVPSIFQYIYYDNKEITFMLKKKK